MLNLFNFSNSYSFPNSFNKKLLVITTYECHRSERRVVTRNYHKISNISGLLISIL